MSSSIFEAHVKSIYTCLRNSLPELQRRFGNDLTIDDIIDTVGTDTLMKASMNASLGMTISSIRGENYSSGRKWFNVVAMYEEALRKQKEHPSYLGAGI